jgi:hypothetical protein
MSFDADKRTVFEPENKVLNSFYETLKKHAPSLAGSKVFEDLVDVYEALEFDTREEKANEPVIRAI